MFIYDTQYSFLCLRLTIINNEILEIKFKLWNKLKNNCLFASFTYQSGTDEFNWYGK